MRECEKQGKGRKEMKEGRKENWINERSEKEASKIKE